MDLFFNLFNHFFNTNLRFLLSKNFDKRFLDLFIRLCLFKHNCVLFHQKKKSEEIFFAETLLSFLLACCIISIIPLLSLKDIRNIEDNKSDYQTKITCYCDPIISTTPIIKYLGKAGNYHFIFNQRESITTIIKEVDIKHILIKKI